MAKEIESLDVLICLILYPAAVVAQGSIQVLQENEVKREEETAHSCVHPKIKGPTSGPTNQRRWMN